MAPFSKPLRTSKHLQHTESFLVQLPKLSIKLSNKDENGTYQTVSGRKPVSGFFDRQLGGSYISTVEPLTPCQVARPFTSPLDYECFGGATSPFWPLHPSIIHFLPPIQPPTPKSLSNTLTPSHRASQPQRDQKDDDYEKLGSAALLKDSVPDFIIPGRKVGRSVDTKAVCSYFNNRRCIRQLAMDEAKNADIRSFFTPINPGNPVTTKRTTKVDSAHDEDSDLSDAPSDFSDQVSDTNAPKAIYPPTNRNATKKSHSSFSHPPVLHKRDVIPPSTPSPDNGVSTWEQEAHLSRILSPHQLICICHQPARTYEVALTQCANPGCVVDWYHKECLDRAGKLKARHGTYVCEQCALAQVYREREDQEGWTVEVAVQNEVGVPFSGEEICGALPGVGGIGGVADPYGLASFSLDADAGAGSAEGMGVVRRVLRLSAEAEEFVPQPAVPQMSYVQVLSSKAA